MRPVILCGRQGTVGAHDRESTELTALARTQTGETHWCHWEGRGLASSIKRSISSRADPGRQNVIDREKGFRNPVAASDLYGRI